MSRLFFKILEFFLIVSTGERSTSIHNDLQPRNTDKSVAMLLRRSPVRGSGLYLAHKLLTFRSMLRLYRAGVGLTSFTFARFATRGFLGWGCSPLDIINYSTGAGDCQEGKCGSVTELSHPPAWLPRGATCCPLLTLFIIAPLMEFVKRKFQFFWNFFGFQTAMWT